MIDSSRLPGLRQEHKSLEAGRRGESDQIGEFEVLLKWVFTVQFARTRFSNRCDCFQYAQNDREEIDASTWKRQHRRKSCKI